MKQTAHTCDIERDVYIYTHTLEIIIDLPLGFPINNIISHIHIYIHIHTHTHTYIHGYIYIYIRMYMYIYIYIYMYAYAHTYISLSISIAYAHPVAIVKQMCTLVFTASV